MSIKTFILMGMFLFGSTANAASPSNQSSIDFSTTKQSLRNVRYEQRLGEQIPLETTWTTETGQISPLSNLLIKKPHILVFAYYRCPNLCTLVLNGLTQALQGLPQHLGKDFDILTVSIDPTESNSLALMKKRTYLARLGTPRANGWNFLVGRENSIRTLTQAAGFYYEKDKISGEYNHPSGIIVLTPEGKLSQYFFGIQFDPKLLDQALQRAGQDKQGSIVEEILLYCFHYDPSVHSKGKAIMAMIRLLGLIGAIGLVGLIVHLSRPITAKPKKDTVA